jgi:hypothetical protein
MHIFCLDYTFSVSKSYPLRVQNKLTTSKVLLKTPYPPKAGPFPLSGGHTSFVLPWKGRGTVRMHGG